MGTSALVRVGQVALPAHVAGGFDHGDVHLPTGRVFVAHTANGTLDVIDGEGLRLEQSLPGCAEGSGVLVGPGKRDLVFAAARGSGKRDLVFAAARGSGELLILDADSFELLNRVPVGPKPNGLAWDADRGGVLVADVETFDARLIEPQTGACLSVRQLPGRPRWCVYDAPRQRFLVNIREPACVVALSAETIEQVARIDHLPAGPHGLDLDRGRDRAFVACDAGVVVVIDLTTDREVARVPIAGEPDAIWFSSAAGCLYVAIGKPGLIAVVDGASLSVVDQVPTEEGAHTTAFDPQRHRLYAFLPRSCAVVAYEETR